MPVAEEVSTSSSVEKKSEPSRDLSLRLFQRPIARTRKFCAVHRCWKRGALRK